MNDSLSPVVLWEVTKPPKLNIQHWFAIKLYRFKLHHVIQPNGDKELQELDNAEDYWSQWSVIGRGSK